jgi:hypothetical protein
MKEPRPALPKVLHPAEAMTFVSHSLFEDSLSVFGFAALSENMPHKSEHKESQHLVSWPRLVKKRVEASHYAKSDRVILQNKSRGRFLFYTLIDNFSSGRHRRI